MIEDARSEREMAALMREAVDCPLHGFSIPDKNFWPITANRISRTGALEHFPAKWIPVCVAKMRQNKVLEHFLGSTEVENALDLAARADARGTGLRRAAARVSGEDLNSLFSTMDVPRKAAARIR